METFDARCSLDHARFNGVGCRALVGGEGELAEEGGEVGDEVWVVCGYVFVEVDFGLGAGFHDDSARFVGEDAVARGCELR